MHHSNQREILKRILTQERRRRMLTQEEVAEAIDASLRNYQRWERGENFPQEFYLRKLREFFGPCIDEAILVSPSDHELNGSSAPHDQEEIKHNVLRSRRNYNHLALIAILLILVFSVALGFVLHITHPYGFGPVKPGGVWISPTGSTVGSIVHFAAYAFPTHPGDPAIDYVNFTAYWPGVNPRAWDIVCQVRFPVRKDVYACDVNLQQLEAPPDQITISFDVYDRQGNVNFSPNGERKIVYSPGT